MLLSLLTPMKFYLRAPGALCPGSGGHGDSDGPWRSISPA